MAAVTLASFSSNLDPLIPTLFRMMEITTSPRSDRPAPQSWNG